LGLEGALRYCAARANAKGGGYVCFANVHTVTEAHDHTSLKKALIEATLAVADGTPLVWVSRLRGMPVESRVCGPDFMTKFLKTYPEISQGFIGGTPNQIQTLAARFLTPAPGYSPPIRPFSSAGAQEDWLKFLALCPNGKPPAIVWVGLGAPKQEFWMQAVTKIAPQTLFMGVGAAFDFLSGTKTRAPLWMQRIGLEWAFRLFQEPGRLWRRYLATNSRFIFYSAQEAFSRVP